MAAVQYATGKRKSAVARVWLTAGNGDITVNERPLAQYFGRPALRNLVQMPFDVSGTDGKFSVTATVAGAVMPGRRARCAMGFRKRWSS